jgi:hypothetical protein
MNSINRSCFSGKVTPCFFLQGIKSKYINIMLFYLSIHPSIHPSTYLSIYLSIRFYNSCRRLPGTKRHSSLFLHWFGSKFLVIMAACTPSIHIFLGRPLFLLSSGILLTWPYHCSLFLCYVILYRVNYFELLACVVISATNGDKILLLTLNWLQNLLPLWGLMNSVRIFTNLNNPNCFCAVQKPSVMYTLQLLQSGRHAWNGRYVEHLQLNSPNFDFSITSLRRWYLRSSRKLRSV